MVREKMGGIAYKFCLAVARQTHRPPLAVSRTRETSLRSSTPPRKARRRFTHLHITKIAHFREQIFEHVEMGGVEPPSGEGSLVFLRA